MFVIVPNSLRDAINEKLNAAYVNVPEAAVDRVQHYHALLNYFNEHGALPEFDLKRNPPTDMADLAAVCDSETVGKAGRTFPEKLFDNGG